MGGGIERIKITNDCDGSCCGDCPEVCFVNAIFAPGDGDSNNDNYSDTNYWVDQDVCDMCVSKPAWQGPETACQSVCPSNACVAVAYEP